MSWALGHTHSTWQRVALSQPDSEHLYHEPEPMAESLQLSPGGAAALLALPCVPQDIRVTIQIKEKLCGGAHYFTVSDGTSWVPAIFMSDFRPNANGLLEVRQIITITKAYSYESWGCELSYLIFKFSKW